MRQPLSFDYAIIPVDEFLKPKPRLLSPESSPGRRSAPSALHRLDIKDANITATDHEILSLPQCFPSLSRLD